MALLQIEDLSAPERAPHPLWSLGFRPFYLLATVWALAAVPLWWAQWSGWWHSPWPGAVWHAHEMVMGYALAVIIGFLFTAGRNWSGQPTPTGRPLMALAALWVLARVLMLTPTPWAAAVVNAAVPLWAAIVLFRALRAGGNRRNYFFAGLLLLLALASGLTHARMSFGLALSPTSLTWALDAVMFMIAVMAGRVVPMFTKNGVPGSQPRQDARVDRVALGALLGLLGADALELPAAVLGPLLAGAAWVHTVRAALWQPHTTWRHPLVWVLHLAYAFLPLHLALRAASVWGAVPPGVAVHALTLGTLGLMTMGMMARTTRGHSGRRIEASAWETAAFGALAGAAFARVFGPWAMPQAAPLWWGVAAALWTGAFALFLARFAPWWVGPSEGQIQKKRPASGLKP